VKLLIILFIVSKYYPQIPVPYIFQCLLHWHLDAASSDADLILKASASMQHT
jgi:hypothetical protein